MKRGKNSRNMVRQVNHAEGPVWSAADRPRESVGPHRADLGHSRLGMAILPRLAWPAPPRFAPCGFSPPRKGDGAGMGQDFRPAPWGGVGMGLHFLDPLRPIPALPHPVQH